MGVKDALMGKWSDVSKIVGRRAAMYVSGGSPLEGLYDEVKDTLGLNNEGITQIVVGFIALAIIVAIGVIILSSIETAMPAVSNTSSYYTLQSSITTTTVSGYGLIVIVLIIVAAAGIMYAVRLIQGGGNR